MIAVRPAARADARAWLEMRHDLWPEASVEEHAGEIEEFLAGRSAEPLAVLVAADETGSLVGFAELSIRPFAEGCDSSRVAYLEGWFVAAAARRRGVGRRLVEAAEAWARAQGCRELASDSSPGNTASLAAHRAVGFADAGLIQCHRKEL